MRSETEADAMHVFVGMTVEQIKMELATELRREIGQLCAAHGWSEDEGLRIVFASGLSVLAHEERMRRLSAGRVNLEAEIGRLERRYMEVESRYAVMKYQAYTLGRDRQILEMNQTGLQVELVGMRQRLLQCRADMERLRTEAETGGMRGGTLASSADGTAERDGSGTLSQSVNEAGKSIDRIAR